MKPSLPVLYVCRQELVEVQSLRMVLDLRMHSAFSMAKMVWFPYQRNTLQNSSSSNSNHSHLPKRW